MSNPTPEAGIEPELSTHDYVAKRLAEMTRTGEVDVTTLFKYYHKKAKLDFYVGALDYDEHKKYRGLKRFEEIQHSDSNKGPDDPIDSERSDKFLLAHAVFTGDGKQLGDDLVVQLLSLKAAGPDNFALISKAEELNPPREFLAYEVAALLNARSVDSVIWRMLMDGGMVEVLMNHMSTRSNPEEKEWAATQLAKAEEMVYALYPMFDADDTARRMGITFKEGMKLIDRYGSPEAVIEAHQKMIQSDIDAVSESPPE